MSNYSQRQRLRFFALFHSSLSTYNFFRVVLLLVGSSAAAAAASLFILLLPLCVRRRERVCINLSKYFYRNRLYCEKKKKTFAHLSFIIIIISIISPSPPPIVLLCLVYSAVHPIKINKYNYVIQTIYFFGNYCGVESVPHVCCDSMEKIVCKCEAHRRRQLCGEETPNGPY